MDKGPVPSDGDVSMGSGILATTIIVTILADTVVALRFIVRKWIVKNIGWDDWCILGAVLGITIGMALVIVQVSYGFGRHKYYLTSHQLQEFQKYSFGEWVQTFATLMWTKISICLFLLRITISKAFIRPLQVAIIILVLSNVILTILWAVQCNPVALAWDLTQQGTCFSVVHIDNIILAQAVISIVSDFFLAAFPILILRHVQINLRVKVGLCLLMGMGVITGCICIARAVLNWENDYSQDPTWVSVPNWYLRSWEVCVGIIAASIPTLRPGYLYMQDRLVASFSSKPSSGAPSSKSKTLVPTPVARTKASNPFRSFGTNFSSTTEGNFLPLQNFEIRKTTQIDVEKKSSRGSDNGLYRPGMGRTDSETRLRSVEDMV
ncbi:hypothetical protein MMC34_005994 [Xylographa carneopallida]|nr:hypothetical protein [Xylographa carneopallida]